MKDEAIGIMPLGPIIGREYVHEQIDFLTKQVKCRDYYTYLGRHPYDNRHIFALKPAGTVLTPDDSPFLHQVLRIESKGGA